jgi:hypothetical protein
MCIAYRCGLVGSRLYKLHRMLAASDGRDDFFLKLKEVGTKLYLSRHCPCIQSEGLRKTTDTIGVVCVPVENRIRQILSYNGIITAVTNLICIWLIITIVLFSTH